MKLKVLILSLAALGFGAAFSRLDDRAHAPRPESPDTLAGCPRVGGGYTHDDRWVTCYACAGETPVCLLIGGAR